MVLPAQRKETDMGTNETITSSTNMGSSNVDLTQLDQIDGKGAKGWNIF